MQENHRLAIRIAALLVIQFVDLRDFQAASVVRLDWTVKSSEFWHARILNARLLLYARRFIKTANERYRQPLTTEFYYG